MLPSACGLGQHFQDLGHSFSLDGPPSRPITYIYMARENLKCNVNEFGNHVYKWKNIQRNGILDEIAQESSPLLTFPKVALLTDKQTFIGSSLFKELSDEFGDRISWCWLLKVLVWWPWVNKVHSHHKTGTRINGKADKYVSGWLSCSIMSY